jgi:phage protein D/phage baseplate assembly protein gpV
MPEAIIIKIDGKENTDLIYDLTEVVVDTNVFIPAMATLSIHARYDIQSDKFDYIDDENLFKIGAELKITVETDEIFEESGKVTNDIFIGEITALEPVFNFDGTSYLTVRAYDRAHKLTLGKKSQAWLKVKEGDIVSKIAGDISLSSDVSLSGGLNGITHEHVFQFNQSDWDFLWSRARAYGYQVYVIDKKLYFNKAGTVRDTGSDPGNLVWGANLGEFRPRVSVKGQVNEAVGSGWDVQKKERIEKKVTSGAKPTPASEIGISEKGSAAVKKAFSSAPTAVIENFAPIMNYADAYAQAVFDDAESQFITAEGECLQGDPRLLAGKKVKVEGVGTRFSGSYYVTEARHVWQGGLYQVQFNVTGNTPNILSHLLQPEMNRNGQGDQFINGVAIGIVTNNDDPDALGRVKVKYPWFSDELESDWVRVSAPSAGEERGILFTPEINDEVLVAFDHGDSGRPFVIGGLWNGKDKIPAGTAAVVSDQKVNQRIIRSRSGHLVILDDTDGKEQIIVQDKTEKNSIVINSSENTMTLLTDGNMIFEAGKDILMKCTGKFTVNSDGDFALDSKGGAELKSSKAFNVQSQMSAKVAGGQSELDLAASGSTLKGMKVDVKADTAAAINGSIMVEIKGGLVKIN